VDGGDELVGEERRETRPIAVVHLDELRFEDAFPRGVREPLGGGESVVLVPCQRRWEVVDGVQVGAPYRIVDSG
jgi:hypothetical protein